MTTAQDVQRLYIAYFGRPADPVGLQYWTTQLNTNKETIQSIANNFALSPEYSSTFTGLNASQIVTAIYQNLFGRLPDREGLFYWAGELTAGTQSIGKIALTIATAARNDAAAGTFDATTLTAKIQASQNFTDAVADSVEEINGYSGSAANALARAYVASVVDATTLTAATANLDATVASVTSIGNEVPGQTYTLTVGVDTLTGTSGNDVFNAAYDPINGLHAFSALDTINGGAGTDTLNITDSDGGNVDLGAISVTNIENLNVRVAGALSGASVDLRSYTGLTSASLDVEQAALLTVRASTATTLNVSNDDAVTINGSGGALKVVADGAVLIGSTAVSNAITSASVTGASTVTIQDRSGASASTGTKLTSVSLDGNTSTANLTGNGIASVSIANATGDVNIARATSHTIALGVDTDTGIVVTDATATTVAITATGDDSDFALAAAAAKTISVAGDVAVTLNAGSADYSALTTVTASGDVSLTADLTGADNLVSVTSTSTGDIDVTIVGTNNASTPAAQSVTTGAGNDTVTITGTLGTGSTLSLGAGSDSVAVSGVGVITSGAVVDAGAGVDTLSLSLVGSANVGAFKNFENFDIAGLTTSFDQAVLNTQNTVTNFVGTAANGSSGLVLQNLGAGVGFIALGDLDVNRTVLTQATGGALSITTNVDETKANSAASATTASFGVTNATSLNVVFDNNNVDKLSDGFANTATISVDSNSATSGSVTSATVVSGGSEVTNYFNFTDGSAAPGSSGAKLATITITGTQALHLDYTGAGGTALATVNASGQTDGGLTFSLVDLRSTGTVTLGAGDDVLTGTTSTTTSVTSSGVQTISGLEKGTLAGLTTQDGFDVINFAGATVAASVTATVGVNHSISHGIYSFVGAGPATLALAVAQIAGDLAVNEAVVFNFAGTTYLYGEGALVAQSDDLLVRLTGVTVAGLDSTAAGTLYVY